MESGNGKDLYRTLVAQLASILEMVIKRTRKIEEVVRFLQIVIAKEDFINLLDAPSQVVNKGVEELLTLVGTVTVPAMVDTFKVKERFVRDVSDEALVKISFVGDNFTAWFGKMTVGSRSGSSLSCHTLNRNAYDRDIISALGGEAKIETTIAEMFWLMEQQKRGGSGILLVNGYANIFYVRDNTRALRAVYVYWYVFGWYVLASGFDSYYWSIARRVFVRNS